MRLQAHLKSSMSLIDIGALAKACGLPPSTLRYYEDLGLIESVARNGLRRQYREDTLLQLALIALGKGAGFSLAQIKAMFDQDRQPALPRPGLLQRAEELERQARRLASLAKLLRHVAECPAPSHLECARFRKLLQAACPTPALAQLLAASARKS